MTLARLRLALALVLGLLGCARGTGGAPVSSYPTPSRAEQAPAVRVQEIIETDTLTGRRVRVTGTCGLVGTGPSTGAWVLKDGEFSIEVRGLVPRSCYRRETPEQLTIFAQVEPKGPESEERLLLRLPE
jgi:hypothetical protein